MVFLVDGFQWRCIKRTIVTKFCGPREKHTHSPYFHGPAYYTSFHKDKLGFTTRSAISMWPVRDFDYRLEIGKLMLGKLRKAAKKIKNNA